MKKKLEKRLNNFLETLEEKANNYTLDHKLGYDEIMYNYKIVVELYNTFFRVSRKLNEYKLTMLLDASEKLLVAYEEILPQNNYSEGSGIRTLLQITKQIEAELSKPSVEEKGLYSEK